MARTSNRVTGVIIQDGKLLLMHRIRASSIYWVFPGGGVEDGEDLETALKREIIEETGLNLMSFAHLFNQPDDHGNLCIFYTCTLEPGEIHLGGPEKEAQSPENQFTWVWVDLNTVAALGTVYPRPFKLLELLNVR